MDKLAVDVPAAGDSWTVAYRNRLREARPTARPNWPVSS